MRYIIFRSPEILNLWMRHFIHWEVNFKKDGHRITHYLEDEDAAPCLEGKQCIGLGLEFGQFL
jgi:hypothetical protein